MKEIERDEFDKVVSVYCGTNHSLALTQSGNAYSWGYSGKALLGRVSNFNENALPLGLGLKDM